MGYVDTGYILGGQESRLAASNAPKHDPNIDQQDFLTLLVAQLTHQDPMNPMEDTEMTGQLAQFSQLEQLTSINTGMDSLIATQTKNDLYDAVSFIGKDVRASGYNVSKKDGSVSKIFYGAGETVAKIKLNIYDKDGEIVRTEEMGGKKAGSYEYEWDGKNDAGKVMPDGVYSVGILAEDLNGEPVMMQTEVAGTVSSVVNDNGTIYMLLDDGRYINFANVKEVVDPVEAAPDGTDGEDNSGSEGDSEDDGENEDESA